MPSSAEIVSLAVMILLGLATAGFLAFMVRDVLARLAGGPEDGHVPNGELAAVQRLALLGPPVYLLGFLVVVIAVLFDPEPVAGTGFVTIGIAIIVLAAAPMAVAFYRAWERT
jgi:hypothetical protein